MSRNGEEESTTANFQCFPHCWPVRRHFRFHNSSPSTRRVLQAGQSTPACRTGGLPLVVRPSFFRGQFKRRNCKNWSRHPCDRVCSNSYNFVWPSVTRRWVHRRHCSKSVSRMVYQMCFVFVLPAHLCRVMCSSLPSLCKQGFALSLLDRISSGLVCLRPLRLAIKGWCSLGK